MAILVKIFEHHGQHALAILLLLMILNLGHEPEMLKVWNTDLPSPRAIPLNQV